MSASESSAARSADKMQRIGIWVVVLEFECAFDESGTHKGSPILCVAGYITEKSQARKLDHEWNAVLNWNQLPHELPYFHMSECAPDPGYGPFEGLTKPQRIQVVSRMIGNIKRRTVQGIAVTINEAEFNELMPPHPLIGSAYSFCAHVIIAGVSNWIEANPRVDRVAYFFEAGHDSQPEADAIMTLLFKNEKARRRHRYAGHAFLPKVGNPIVQAADLLAWQWFTDKKHELASKRRRKDCDSLLQHHHNAVHIDRSKIEFLVAAFGSRMPDAETFNRLYFGDRK